jgi:hypothetical protein
MIEKTHKVMLNRSFFEETIRFRSRKSKTLFEECD